MSKIELDFAEIEAAHNIALRNTYVTREIISSEQLDSVALWASNEYPDAGLILIGCKDGRWFVEVEFGNRFDGIIGLSRPALTPYSQPVFFSGRTEALDYALSCMKAVYPELAGINLKMYYAS